MTTRSIPSQLVPSRQPATIALDTYVGHQICDYVEAVGPAPHLVLALIPADNATGNFTKIVRRFVARIRPNATDPNKDLLKPGMSTTVAVAVEGAAVDGCRFDPERDRAPSALPRLPAHAGLGRDNDPAALGEETFR